MKVKFYTLGCKVNQYESQAMSEQLQRHGFETVKSNEAADIFVVNSCTVTAAADQKTRQAVRRFKRNNPDGIVVLTGCVPQAYPDKAKELIEADIVIGNKNNHTLYAAIKKHLESGCRVFDVSEHKKDDLFCGDCITSFEERTRAYVKIQDGCNRFCSYCVIPYSRGRVRSKPIDEIRKEVSALAENGYKEVVLVGINLSSYGADISSSFPEAVRAANDVDGILRVRLGSLEPDHLTDEVIEKLKQCEKLCPQFHISLQSGCNNTLKKMNRHYTAEEYRHLCHKLRSTFENCTLTTDIMVGFAGETDEDFNESLEFAREIGFEKIHVFPYSVRKGTRAEKLTCHLTKKIKEDRAKAMTDMAENLRREFFKGQIGKKYDVLFESEDEDGYFTGHTANYIPVKSRLLNKSCSEPIEILITDTENNEYCIGVPV